MTPRECQDLGAQIEAEQDPAKKAQLQARYNEFCLTDGSGNHVPTPPPPPVN